MNFTNGEIFPTNWNLSDCNENETYSDEDELDMIEFNPSMLRIMPRIFNTGIQIGGSNDTVLDAGALGFARSFSLPMPSAPEDYDFNLTTPVVLYSSMPVTTWLFSDAVDDSDYGDYEEDDYDTEEFIPQNLLSQTSADPKLVELDADDTLEEGVTTEKPIHKTTRKRKVLKKKQKKKRKTTKRRRSKTTKKPT